MDWDTFYFEYWVVEHGYSDDKMPTNEDYQSWLFDKVDLAYGSDS